MVAGLEVSKRTDMRGGAIRLSAESSEVETGERCSQTGSD